MYQSKPSIQIQECSSESDDSDDGEEKEPLKKRKISLTSFSNALNDERQFSGISIKAYLLFLTFFRLPEATPAGRIGARFEESVSSVLEIILDLPDDQHKLDLIQEAIQQIRVLRTEVQYNAHMAILSTIVVDTDDQKEDGERGKANVD